MPNPLALVWDLIAHDNASPAFLKVGAAADASHTKISGFGKSLGTLFAAGALADVGVHMAKMAGDFQQQTNVLVTAAGESTKNLGLIRNGILDIATGTGTTWQSLTDGIYGVEKAGYRGADALKILKAAAQGAREEGANLATVTNAMTSVMASYHLGAEKSVMVMNEMKTAAGEAKTTMELFAGSLSTVLPLASANKISFADIAGSLASLTQHGTSADEAAQELAFTMRGLAAPNAVAVKEMAQLGISSVDVATKLGDGPGGRGLAGTLNYLSETVLKKMGPSGTILLNTFNQSKVAAADAQTMFNALPPAVQKIATAYMNGTLTLKQYRAEVKGLPADQAALASQWATTENAAMGFQQTLRTGLAQNQTYSDAIKRMTGGANGLNTTLQLTGASMDGTNERIKRIAESAKLAGTNVSGWDSTQKLFNVKMDEFKQQIEVTAIRIGTALIPVVTKVAGYVGGFFKTLSNNKPVLDTFIALIGVALVTALGRLVVSITAATVASLKGFTSMILGWVGVGKAATTAAAEAEVADAKIAAGNEAATLTSGKAGGAASLMGGAFGLTATAVLGASAALAKYIDAGKASIPIVFNMTQSATALNTALINNSGSAEQVSKSWVQAQLQSSGLADKAAKAGITVDQMTKAIMGGVVSTHDLVDVWKASGKPSQDTILAMATLAINYAITSKNAADLAGKTADLKNQLDKVPGSYGASVVVNGIPNALSGLSLLTNALLNIPSPTVKVNYSTVNYPGLPLTPVPGHASGGFLSPGWNLVGEQGPELIGPNRMVYPTGQTTRAMGGDMSGVIAAVNALSDRVDHVVRSGVSTLATARRAGVSRADF